MSIPAPRLDQVRTQLRQAVRATVGGRQGERVRAEIESRTDDGWFGPGHPVQLVHGDVATMVGGVRALLLQSLHPLAMAGVADHSNFRDDPWGRLQRTAAFMALTTFGSTSQAEAACRQVLRVHQRVVGVAADGRPYAANDPHLLLWVHVAEVDSFLTANQRYGRYRLDAREADGYVAGMTRVAEELGAEAPPATVAELRAALRGFLPELRATTEARQALRFLLNPPMPLSSRLPYAAVFAAGAALLPWWAKASLRLPPLIVADATVVRPATKALLDVMRWSADGA